MKHLLLVPLLSFFFTIKEAFLSENQHILILGFITYFTFRYKINFLEAVTYQPDQGQNRDPSESKGKRKLM